MAWVADGYASDRRVVLGLARITVDAGTQTPTLPAHGLLTKEAVGHTERHGIR